MDENTMLKAAVAKVKEIYRRNTRFWVDGKEEDGRFPIAPSDDATSIAKTLRYLNESWEVGEIAEFYNGRPIVADPAVQFVFYTD